MRARGFTLIELIVVIVIIAILAAFLFPVMKGVIERGHQGYCSANLAQIGQALRQYQQDHRAFPPAPLDGTGNYVPTSGLVGLMRNKLPMVCRSDQRDKMLFIAADGTVGTNPGFQFSYAYDDENRLTAGIIPALVKQRLLYNFWGYTNEGYEIVPPPDLSSWYELYRTGGVPPVPVTAWTKFPFLVNTAAPPNTIVTHCPFHRGNGIELILRLDGAVQSVPDCMVNEANDVTRWEAEAGGTPGTYPGKWVTQQRD